MAPLLGRGSVSRARYRNHCCRHDSRGKGRGSVFDTAGTLAYVNNPVSLSCTRRRLSSLSSRRSRRSRNVSRRSWRSIRSLSRSTEAVASDVPGTSGGTDRNIVLEPLLAGWNLRCSSAGPIANSPVSEREADNRPDLISRAIVGLDLPVARATQRIRHGIPDTRSGAQPGEMTALPGDLRAGGMPAATRAGSLSQPQ